MHSKLDHQSILNMIAAVVEYNKNELQISSSKRLSPPQLRPRAVTPQKIKSNSSTLPCPRTTKQSNAAQSHRHALAPQNIRIQLNHSPMLSYHKTTTSSSIAPQCSHTTKQSNTDSITPPDASPQQNSQIWRYHSPMSRAKTPSSPAQSLPHALASQNHQIQHKAI